MQFLSVNYHYVREGFAAPYESIYPVTPTQLEEQLLSLGRHFEFLSGETLLRLLRTKSPFPDRSLFLTFDDGLKEHYEKVLPILKKHSIPAVFFVSPKPAVYKKALPIHKIHYTRAYTSPEDILPAILLAVEKKNSSVEKQMAEAVLTYKYDKPEHAVVKWCLNFILNAEERETLIDRFFRKLVRSEKEWVDTFYMGKTEIRELFSLGYLGNHCLDHVALATVSESESRRQIQKSRDLLVDICGGFLPILSYPIGSLTAVTRRDAEIAKELGYEAGLTTEKAVNLTAEDPLLFGRIDCTDALLGKRSQMVEKEGSLHFQDFITVGRKRYLQEKKSSS